MKFPKLSNIRVLKQEEMSIFTGGTVVEQGSIDNKLDYKPDCDFDHLPGCMPAGKRSSIISCMQEVQDLKLENVDNTLNLLK